MVFVAGVKALSPNNKFRVNEQVVAPIGSRPKLPLDASSEDLVPPRAHTHVQRLVKLQRDSMNHMISICQGEPIVASV